MQQVDTPPAPTGAPEQTRPQAIVPVPKTRRLQPFRVVLHNDDVNEMTYVVRTIRQLTILNQFRAARAMLEAHVRGRSLLLVTHKERAELYREQFRSKHLTVTIEPEA